MGFFKKIFIPAILAAFIATGLNSCCFKKDNCNIREANREITFRLNEDVAAGGFTRQETQQLKYIIVNPATQNFDDTGFFIHHFNDPRFNSSQNAGLFSFEEIFPGDTSHRLKNKHLIVFLPGTGYADTVFTIDYTVDVEKYKCNECFASYDISELKKVTNRTAQYRGKQFVEAQFPITITKN